MKAERLMNILLLLQAKGRVTTSRLAKRMEVSTRTIHRDMEALAASGVPVYAERGKEGGWFLSEGYRTDLTGMKAEELRALSLVYTTSALNDTGMGSSFESAFLKLLASVPAAYRKEVESIRERVHIDATGWPQKIHSTPLLPLLLHAAEKNESLLVDYDKQGTLMQRTVDPLGLVAKGTIWYLVTRERGRFRTFRVTNLRGARRTGSKFERPESFQLQNYWNEWWDSFRKTIPRYVAEVEVSDRELAQIRWYPGLRLLRTLPGGKERSRLRIDFETEEWATRMILWMGADAKVISPVTLRRRVCEEASKIALSCKE